MTDRADPYASFRFAVQIDGLTEARFTECTLPSLEVEIEEQKEGGYNAGTHVLPGRVRRGTLVLRRGIVSSSELLQWYSDIMQGQLGRARRQVSITLLDSQGQPVMRWDFQGAFPCKWTGPELNTASASIAIESLELAYESVLVS